MWYKFSKQDVSQSVSKINLNGFYDQQEMGKFLNSPIKPVQKIEQLADSGLENMLDPARENSVIDPKKLNELRQPIRTKSTGGGADALLNTNKDIPIYSDNFTNTSGWNS